MTVYRTEVAIPSIYNGKPVTEISSSAFYKCSSLTSIIIPDSVTSIDNYAFYKCSSLTQPYTSKLSTTDEGYIIYTDGELKSLIGYTGTQTDLILSNDITEINQYAFRDCSSLTSITIPDSVTNIGEYAFYGCSSLTSVTIPDSVTRIGNSAFYGCSSLTSVIFKNTNDWKLSENSSYSNVLVLSSSDLSNALIAAIDLTTEFYDFTWKRG